MLGFIPLAWFVSGDRRGRTWPREWWSHAFTASPVRQMDQGSNSEISPSAESERNKDLWHNLNLPLCKTNLRLSRSATTRWCASRSPKRTWISCARGCWRRWSSRPMTQAPASPRVNGEIGARAKQRVWLLHSTGCCVYSLQGFDLTCAFLYTTPYPAWIEQNTDVYSLLGFMV